MADTLAPVSRLGARRFSFSNSMIPWVCIIALATVAALAADALPWLKAWPSAWIVPVTGVLNSAMEWFSEFVEPVTRAISAILEWPMVTLRDALQWLPWPVLVAAIVLLAFHASGLRLALVCLAALLYVALSGYWIQAMNTLALVGIAVPLSLALGLGFGIWSSKTRTGSRVVPPLLDLMQTMPTFAYLIPLLVMFGFGPVVGLIASAVYACPPMVRNVHLGLKGVPSEIIEAATISGSTGWQKLFWVELPAAMTQIKVGMNQTIMAALSMVIIASVIGGFNDIGWEVLSTMRKARFGESLLAGLVIVLIAVVMDRISAAYTNSERPAGAWRPAANTFWTVVAALVVSAVVIKLVGWEMTIEEARWSKNIALWLNEKLEAVVIAYGELLTSIKNTLFFFYLLPIRIGFTDTIQTFTWGFEFTAPMRWSYIIGAGVLALGIGYARSWRIGIAIAAVGYLLYFGFTGLPWVVVVAVVATIAWQVGGARTGVFALVSLLFIAATGMWEPAMLSVYLCGAAAVMSFLFGASLGIWAASSDRVSAVLKPVADTFQTIPLFVFLIPVLMFFQIGEFTALLAIIAYAFVPALRYTESGLRQVSPELLEVAVEQGCTSRQIFWQIKLPLAIPSIMVGFNQTVMFSFAMLVIAALVGTTGLGQQIFVALSSADVGLGVVAGLSMALLAMIVDRIMQSWARERFAALDA